MRWFFLVLLLLSAARSGAAQDVEQGTHSDALIYSVHHDTVSLAINFGSNVGQDKRQRVLHFIDQNIFSGDHEVPIICFIGADVGGDGLVCVVYINGNSYQKAMTEQEYFNLTTLNDEAENIVGVFKIVSGNYKR